MQIKPESASNVEHPGRAETVVGPAIDGGHIDNGKIA